MKGRYYRWSGAFSVGTLGLQPVKRSRAGGRDGRSVGLTTRREPRASGSSIWGTRRFIASAADDGARLLPHDGRRGMQRLGPIELGSQRQGLRIQGRIAG